MNRENFYRKDFFSIRNGGAEAFAEYESVTVLNQTTYDSDYNTAKWKAMLKVQNTPMEEAKVKKCISKIEVVEGREGEGQEVC